MNLEPEVALAAEIRGMGCPYACTDPRSTAWLEGFGFGVRKGKQVALDAIRDEFALSRGEHS
jgi:hypothetical protein